MLFNSVEYLIFLPVVVLIYYLLPAKMRWLFLLFCSYYFYMQWEAAYALLIAASTVTDYFAARAIHGTNKKKKKNYWLVFSLVVNLGILFVFKYYNFFAVEIANKLQLAGLESINPALPILLPVGISFYTFQTISYTVDVYNNKVEPERNFGRFALYVSFFPQLVAGPIERFTHLGQQLKRRISLRYDNLANGSRLILFGLFTKMVIADNLAPLVDTFYENPEEFGQLASLQAVVFYSFQIYCDFHGYSLIAIGSARLLGFDLMDNFRTPYMSQGLREFWQRWHISLSTWFQSYLYLQLGGNKVSLKRWIFNILVVFSLSGLWHGANWTFIFWGLIHGLLYLSEKLLHKRFQVLSSMWRPLKVLLTFSLVTLAWVFFRSPDIQFSSNVFQNLFGFGKGMAQLEVSYELYLLLLLFVFSDWSLRNNRFDHWIAPKHPLIRWGCYSVLLFCLMALSGIVHQPFIYFQF